MLPKFVGGFFIIMIIVIIIDPNWIWHICAGTGHRVERTGTGDIYELPEITTLCVRRV